MMTAAKLDPRLTAIATTMRYPNCVQFENKIFRQTDVVGDAHRLPFREAMFDRVFGLNVFEHLRDPRAHRRTRTGPPPQGFESLQNLPPNLQARIAAGFELFARKPTNPS